jgi:6-phosphogluconate dehydrogenase
MAAHFGMVGLGTMGSNLLLNVADHGFEACGYDRDATQRDKLIKEAEGKKISVVSSPKDFVEALQTPRIIMLLVPAGSVVDMVVADLLPLLQEGDMIIDGGNSHFVDTERRYNQLLTSGIHFIGMGVSGGEDGARLGPSMMPGGTKASYDIIRHVLEPIAAASDDGPCIAFMGNSAAGHYVKMVHNGIEYAIMQLISEVYDLLKRVGKMDNAALAQLFTDWNNSELQSYLIELTSNIFNKKDDITKLDLVDMILDKARQKGTGKWTSQSAMDLNVPVPTIDAAVSMRYLSSMKDDRIAAAKLYGTAQNGTEETDVEQLKELAKNGLHFCFILSYAQGLHLLKAASSEYHYDIDIAQVLRVWKAGCIIRSALLNDLKKAYEQYPSINNFIESPFFQPILSEQRTSLDQLVEIATKHRIPAAALSATLQYFDAYCTERLPANLIQAQRDNFGAHTYERLDKPGIYHTNWNTDEQP